MVYEVDKNPSSVSQASASPEHEYDKSIIAVAEVPALSPRSALPTEYPLTALLAVSAAQWSPPEANSPLYRHAVLQA